MRRPRRRWWVGGAVAAALAMGAGAGACGTTDRAAREGPPTLAAGAAPDVPAAPATAADGSVTVDAGALRARMTARPWSLRFTDARGRAVLTASPRIGDGSEGALGLLADGTWRHATEAVELRPDGAGAVATLATDDPAGRRLAVRVRPSGDGQIAVTAEAVPVPGAAAPTRVGAGFDARPGERFLGLGERSTRADQRGVSLGSQVFDGPWQPGEATVVTPTSVPPWGFGRGPEATYFPIPWVLSSAGYGVLVDNDEESVHHLDDRGLGIWSVDVGATRLALRVFAGPRPADALRRFSAAVGRQPRAAAPWLLGPWYQPSGDESAVVAKMRADDVPGSALNTYLHYLPCGDQRGEGRREAERARVRRLHAAGYAVTTYVNPMICTRYPEAFGPAAAKGLLARKRDGSPYTYTYLGNEVGQLDFAAPGIDTFVGSLLAAPLEDGFDGWMEDFGEYTPPDAVTTAGVAGSAGHDRYPREYHRSYFRAATPTPARRRPVIGFVRSGWTGSARWSRAVWGGDPTTSYGFDGLRSAVTQGLTMGLSGVSLWGSDIGGFFTLGKGVPGFAPQALDVPLLKRWIEAGTFFGVMRTEADGLSVPETERPQVFDDAVRPLWRRYAKLRTQLYPYLDAADAEYRRTGLPLMRQLTLTDPGDPVATGQEDEYRFGPDLLVAPVLDAGATGRDVYLPRGSWIDLTRALAYRPGDGAYVAAPTPPRPLAGGRTVRAQAGPDEIPVYARAGALLGLLPATVDTLAPYGPRSRFTHLDRRLSTLRLLGWPSPRASTTRLADGTRFAARATRATLTVRVLAAPRPVARTLSLELSTAAAGPGGGRVCSVTAGGRPLPRAAWRFGPASRVLTATVRVPATRQPTTIVARRCA